MRITTANIATREPAEFGRNSSAPAVVNVEVQRLSSTKFAYVAKDEQGDVLWSWPGNGAPTTDNPAAETRLLDVTT